MKLPSQDERRSLRHRYIKSDLYRQWSPILSMLHRDHGETDAETLWYMAEQKIVNLRNEQSFREQEIAPIYNELLSECRCLDGTTRSEEQCRRTTSTVMCIILTMLMNAVEKDHEEEFFDNEPMCMAIMDIFIKDSYFNWLMNLFFERKKGYDGKEVVISPCDPMQKNAFQGSFDNTAKEEVVEMIEKVLSHTQCLKPFFEEYWNVWEGLWHDICADTELFVLLKKEEPRKNEWRMSLKMVFNVIGIFKNETKIKTPDKQLNDVICSQNRRSYISNHADFEGSDSVFEREQHEKIKRMIDDRVLSKK